VAHSGGDFGHHPKNIRLRLAEQRATNHDIALIAYDRADALMTRSSELKFTGGSASQSLLPRLHHCLRLFLLVHRTYEKIEPHMH
jgi:hypothetical protein